MGPFVMTFFISLFILLMQFLWKYIDDLVGKGLEWHVIGELMFYASASLVSLALPLSVLISSIMTMGSLGEHYELVSLRSAGISLGRVMYPLIIFSIAISGLAFYFSNNLLPIANLKMGTLLYDIRHKKPTMDLRPGVFYKGIDNYSIRIGSKGDDEVSLYDLLIYDHTENKGNNKVITADSGRMEFEGDRYLMLTLFNGNSYEQQDNRSREERTYPHMRNQFQKQIIRFDMAEFSMRRSNEDIFKDNYKMQSLGQLSQNIDTLNASLVDRKVNFYENLNRNFTALKSDTSNLIPHSKKYDTALSMFNEPQHSRIAEAALNMARSTRSYTHSAKDDIAARTTRVDRYWIEVHRKFTLSIACLILFFIGAPLGAIIRKGGLGMPTVFSIVFFLIYYLLSITGEKFAKEGLWTVVEGMWLSSAVLFPVGLFLTYKATTDSKIFEWESYFKPVKLIFESIRKKLNPSADSSSLS
ncbi:MAG: lipopolysaccharide export system permease protein [Bacteroidia bacterium]|jgi:lipopolysaccharide export system permease protein